MSDISLITEREPATGFGRISLRTLVPIRWVAIAGQAMRSMTPGSSVPQTFDHLADRNLALIRKNAERLMSEARTSFKLG